ncbi:MAG TPA: hypothetical protein VF483_13175, partial [Gemmatimonadaceae bacterium]
MDHTPTLAESAFLQDAFGLAVGEFAFVRLSATMLDKSIIDANDLVRFLLKSASIADFEVIGQGAKVQREIELLAPAGRFERSASFYRPNTKQGDPRFWIYQLARNARAGDLLALGSLRGTLFAVVVDPVSEDLRALLRRFVEEIAGPEEDLEKDIADLTTQLKGVFAQGWIPAIGRGAPAVGETLEAK